MHLSGILRALRIIPRTLGTRLIRDVVRMHAWERFSCCNGGFNLLGCPEGINSPMPKYQEDGCEAIQGGIMFRVGRRLVARLVTVVLLAIIARGVSAQEAASPQPADSPFTLEQCVG